MDKQADIKAESIMLKGVFYVRFYFYNLICPGILLFSDSSGVREAPDDVSFFVLYLSMSPLMKSAALNIRVIKLFYLYSSGFLNDVEGDKFCIEKKSLISIPDEHYVTVLAGECHSDDR